MVLSQSLGYLCGYRQIFVYTFCLINICSSPSDDANEIKPLNIERAYTVSVISENLSPIPHMVSEKFSSKNSKILQTMYGSLTFLPHKFCSFSWLIFPSVLHAKSLKLHKFLNLISSFNVWI